MILECEYKTKLSRLSLQHNRHAEIPSNTQASLGTSDSIEISFNIAGLPSKQAAPFSSKQRVRCRRRRARTATAAVRCLGMTWMVALVSPMSLFELIRLKPRSASCLRGRMDVRSWLRLWRACRPTDDRCSGNSGHEAAAESLMRLEGRTAVGCYLIVVKGKASRRVGRS